MKPQYIEIDVDGNKFYYADKGMTKLHREDGPAIEYADGRKRWYVNGKYLTGEQFNNLKKPSSCAGKIVIEIDGKKYKLIEQ